MLSPLEGNILSKNEVEESELCEEKPDKNYKTNMEVQKPKPMADPAS
jgi:hypothetical protein